MKNNRPFVVYRQNVFDNAAGGWKAPLRAQRSISTPLSLQVLSLTPVTELRQYPDWLRAQGGDLRLDKRLRRVRNGK
jgi:hypothetical protein